MDDEAPDEPSGEPPEPEEELEELDLADPLKRDEDLPGLDPFVALPPD